MPTEVDRIIKGEKPLVKSEQELLDFANTAISNGYDTQELIKFAPVYNTFYQIFKNITEKASSTKAVFLNLKKKNITSTKEIDLRWL